MNVPLSNAVGEEDSACCIAHFLVQCEGKVNKMLSLSIVLLPKWFFFLNILVLYVQKLNVVVFLSFIVVICAQELTRSRSLS